jgi:Cytochrome P450
VYLRRNEWLIAGRDDVLATMRSSDAVVTALYPAALSPTLNELFLGLLSFENGDAHRRLRDITRSRFTASATEELSSHVAAVIDRELYPFVFEPTGADVVGGVGAAIPEAISGLLLDVDPIDWPSIGAWSRAMYQQMGRFDLSPVEIAAGEAAHHAFRDYVRRRMRDGTQHHFGGVGELLLLAWRKGELSDQELERYFALFLFTGLDTLTYAIANSLWFLANSPELFANLRTDPAAADRAFGEAMRLWGPIRICVRYLQNAVPLGAGAIPGGSIVYLLLHAANRDSRRLERPGEALLDRKGGERTAFGVGAHGCMGTAIGLLVGRLLFRSVATRCERIWATPGEDPRFIPSMPILGIDGVRLFAEPVRRGQLDFAT